MIFRIMFNSCTKLRALNSVLESLDWHAKWKKQTIS
jgi:hypothetical protein